MKQSWPNEKYRLFDVLCVNIKYEYMLQGNNKKVLMIDGLSVIFDDHPE